MNIITRARSLITKASLNPLAIDSPYQRHVHVPRMNFDRMVKEYRNWTYACVKKNSDSVAALDLLVFKKTARGQEPEEVLEHEIIDLFKTVNPITSNFEMKSLLVSFLELTGNAYWNVAKDRLNRVREIWNIPSNWVKIVPGSREPIDRYEVMVPGRGTPIIFMPDEIIHFKYPNPNNPLYGFGPLAASAHSVMLSNEMLNFSSGIFKNNARPDGALTTDQKLNAVEVKRLRAQWEEVYRGTENAGKIAVLEAGLTYNQIAISPRDLDYSQGGKDQRTQILSIFGVPASKLGIVEDVNRANAEANDFTYQKETIAPKLRLIEQKINEQLMPMIDPTVEVHFEENVPQNAEFELKERTDHITAGVISINEAREEIGMKPIEGGESPLVSFNLTPLTDAADTTPMPVPDFTPGGQTTAPVDDNDDGKGLTAVQKRSGRRQRWRAFIAKTHALERQLKRIYMGFFAEQEKEVLANVNRLKTQKQAVNPEVFDFIGFSFGQNVERVRDLSTTLIEDVYRTGVNIGFADLGIAAEAEGFFPRFRTTVNQVINESAFFVNMTNRNGLIKAVSAGLEAGETMAEIGTRVGSFYQTRIKSGSLMVARTITTGIANKGQEDAYKDSGVVEKVEWVTAKDEAVRDTHRELDGQVVNLGETFRVPSTGTALRWPGDPQAPIEEIANCRCTTIAKTSKSHSHLIKEMKDVELSRIREFRQKLEIELNEL